MGFDRIHNVSQNQLSVILIARFIMIVICTQFIFKPCKTIIKTTLNKDLSLMKITHYLIRHPKKLIQIILDLYGHPDKPGETIKTMSRYCSYDKRQKRTHYEQDLERAFH